MKKTFFVISIIISIILIVKYAYAQSTVTIKGSDTMVILAQRWAEAYMSKYPGTIIQVTGGGSGTGISALINGTTDICNSSRPMNQSEREKLKQRYNTPGVEVRAAKDGIAIYVNESNAVNELTLAQIKSIYTGELDNWSQVGGQNAKIILYGRENSSGTYVFFRDHVLEGNDYSANTQSLPGTAAVVNAIAQDKFGIGYGGTAYGKGIKIIKVKKDEATPGYEPTQQSVSSDLYPISRYLYMYLRNQPTGEVKKYIDFTLSEEGQQIVSEVGYFPIK